MIRRLLAARRARTHAHRLVHDPLAAASDLRWERRERLADIDAQIHAATVAFQSPSTRREHWVYVPPEQRAAGASVLIPDWDGWILRERLGPEGLEFISFGPPESSGDEPAGPRRAAGTPHPPCGSHHPPMGSPDAPRTRLFTRKERRP